MSYYDEPNQCCSEILYVIAVISNPAEFKRRYELFEEFCIRMKKNNRIKLITVELQQQNRDFKTSANIKLKADDELWHKENLINIGVKHLPKGWKYMAWIDADIEFLNERWAQDTLSQLQTYSVVQLFSHCIELGPKKETLQVHTGFGYMQSNGEKWHPPSAYSKYHHTGYAWAITRKAYSGIGNLPSFCILGSGDTHTALSFIGEVDASLHSKLHPNYKLLCRNFQERCKESINGNIGYVHGSILHYFHGDKINRAYKTRWNILISNNYDPLMDIVYDSDGLIKLTGNKPKLRDDIRRYFRERIEDQTVKNQDYKYSKAKWF